MSIHRSLGLNCVRQCTILWMYVEAYAYAYAKIDEHLPMESTYTNGASVYFRCGRRPHPRQHHAHSGCT